METVKDGFSISTEKRRLQIDVIDRFLAEESYWAAGRTPEQTRTAIENSICFGIYFEGQQVGFARVVSDRATFAYIGDVFIIEEFRGKGLASWLLQAIIDHPDLQGLRRWVLATRDAHSLYEKFGFQPLRFPDRWMERAAPDAY